MTRTAAAPPRVQTDWVMCPGCRAPLYGKRLARNQQVCPECGFHYRLDARTRVEQLFDADSWRLLASDVPSVDVLEFTDTLPYPDRLAAARASTAMTEAALLASGTILGQPVIAAVLDFRFLGGSLGAAVGELITRAAELALARHTPLLIVSASGGARMQEGVISLMQMAKTSQALGRLDEAGVLTISLITDPTFGGVAASFATLCDVIIAEPGARMGFAGPRVIAQTIRQTLPAGFQTAEFLLAHGLIDLICRRGALRPTLARLLSLGSAGRWPGRRERAGGAVTDRAPDATGTADPDPTRDTTADETAEAAVVVRDHHRLPTIDAWQAVRNARHLDRPTVQDYLALAFTEFQELHGDRIGGDCPAIVGGLARLDDTAVMVIGQQKGHTAAELAARNYGMPTPAGYRKAARLMRMAEKLGLPVITIVDTPGAYPGIAAEEQGQAVAIAENIRLMSSLRVPVITLIAGEGGSGGALALAVADEVLISANGVYSVISPEGCAAILWDDPGMAPAAAAALRVDARQLLRLGVVDGVVLEPEGGNQADHQLAAARVRTALVAALRRRRGADGAALVAARRNRFRSFGLPTPAAA